MGGDYVMIVFLCCASKLGWLYQRELVQCYMLYLWGAEKFSCFDLDILQTIWKKLAELKDNTEKDKKKKKSSM